MKKIKCFLGLHEYTIVHKEQRLFNGDYIWKSCSCGVIETGGDFDEMVKDIIAYNNNYSIDIDEIDKLYNGK